MRKLSMLFFVLAAMLLLSSALLANPRAEVKASPLFKASLEQTIARLEGVVESNNEEEMPTGRPGCPQPEALPGETLEGSCSSTCNYTCGPCPTTQTTCAGTCANTCASTCAGSGPTYQGGSCCNARFYGTISWKNTYWNWPSGGSTLWSTYLSPYNDLRDWDYWNSIGPDGGYVLFNYSGQNIEVDLFAGNNGYYDGTIAAPNVSSYDVNGLMTSYYYDDWQTNWLHYNGQHFSGQPISSRQVNVQIPINRP